MRTAATARKHSDHSGDTSPSKLKRRLPLRRGGLGRQIAKPGFVVRPALLVRAILAAAAAACLGAALLARRYYAADNTSPRYLALGSRFEGDPPGNSPGSDYIDLGAMLEHVGDVGRAGYYRRYRVRPDGVNAISILGERNSGTNWIYTHLNECFNNSIPVLRELTRYKHWFQYHNASKVIPNTLVVAMFRNVYEWVEAMRRTPHHASNHVGLEWREFLTKPWTTDRVGLDLELWERINRTMSMSSADSGGDLSLVGGGRICQDNFRFHEVISCHKRPLPNEYWEEHNDHSYSQRQPLYELRRDGSGLPYRNILELRADKIRNFLETKEYEGVRDVWVVRYEDLLKKGTASLVNRLEEATGMKARCEPYGPQKSRRQRRVDYDMVQWLIKHVDWEAEEAIGYRK